MIEYLETHWWVMFIIMGIATFIAWCLGRASKDDYWDEHEDYCQFVEEIEKDKPDIMKDQAS